MRRLCFRAFDRNGIKILKLAPGPTAASLAYAPSKRGTTFVCPVYDYGVYAVRHTTVRLSLAPERQSAGGGSRTARAERLRPLSAAWRSRRGSLSRSDSDGTEHLRKMGADPSMSDEVVRQLLAEALGAMGRILG